jgi:hypothetical protein
MATPEFVFKAGEVEMKFESPDGLTTKPMAIDNQGRPVIDSDPIAVIFGTEYKYAEDNSESSTSSTSYIQKLRLTTDSVPAGDYRVGWSMDAKTSNKNKTVEFKIEVDDTTVLDEDSTDLNNYTHHSGFDKITLASGVHTIDVDMKRTDSPASCYVRNVRLEFWRIT